jgi:hypothetical protein
VEVSEEVAELSGGLLGAEDEVDPLRQVLADLGALQCPAVLEDELEYGGGRRRDGGFTEADPVAVDGELVGGQEVGDALPKGRRRLHLGWDLREGLEEAVRVPQVAALRLEVKPVKRFDAGHPAADHPRIRRRCEEDVALLREPRGTPAVRSRRRPM